MKVTDEYSRIRISIRILLYSSEVLIPGSGPKFHGSATLISALWKQRLKPGNDFTLPMTMAWCWGEISMVMMTGVLCAMLWHMWSISSRVASFTRLPSHSHPCHNSVREHQWIILVISTKEDWLNSIIFNFLVVPNNFNSKPSARFYEKNVHILHFNLL